MKYLIAGKDCKCWIFEKPHKRYNTVLCYKKNGYVFYITDKKTNYGFLANDVSMPKYWELINDTILRKKWNKTNYYDLKIIKLNKDTFETLTILPNNTFFRDTMFTVPDTLTYLIDKYNKGSIIDTIMNTYYVE
jgi:hypothetical protein